MTLFFLVDVITLSDEEEVIGGLNASLIFVIDASILFNYMYL